MMKPELSQQQRKQITRSIIAQGEFAGRSGREWAEIEALSAARQEAISCLRRAVLVGDRIRQRAILTAARKEAKKK